MISINTSYKKALKVIDSCENEYHIKAARNYCNNFFKVYATEAEISHGTQLFSVDSLYASAYERLLRKLHTKSLNL